MTETRKPWQVEDERRRDRSRRFDDILPELARELGLGWKAVRQHDYGQRLRRESDGLELWVACDDWKGRGRVSPSIPRFDGEYLSLRSWGVIGYDEKTPEMSFALERDPARVAREIERKVLAPYEPLYVEILKRKAERLERANDAVSLWRQLRDLVGCRRPVRNDLRLTSDREIHFGDAGSMSGTMTVFNYGSVELRIRWMTSSQALAMAKAIGALAATEEAA